MKAGINNPIPTNLPVHSPGCAPSERPFLGAERTSEKWLPTFVVDASRKWAMAQNPTSIDARRAVPQARCGSSPLPSIACASRGGYFWRPSRTSPSVSRTCVSSPLLGGYDEPDILSYSIQPIRLKRAGVRYVSAAKFEIK